MLQGYENNDDEDSILELTPQRADGRCESAAKVERKITSEL